MGFNPKDLIGLSKPLTKLIDTVGRGVGRVTKSYFTRKDADAKAYEIRQLADAKGYETRALAQAQADAEIIQRSTEIPEVVILPDNESSEPKLLTERASERHNYQDTVGQGNIEEITANAAEELVKETEISEEPVSQNWINRFFKMAEDVSDEDMQILWGRILAGEVKHPGSFSLRTLNVLRNISKREAEIFMKVSQFAVQPNRTLQGNDGSLILTLNAAAPVEFLDLLLLKEIGLLNPTDVSYNIHPIVEATPAWFVVGKKAIIFERSNRETLTFQGLRYSTIGEELLKISAIDGNVEYINELNSYLQKIGYPSVRIVTVNAYLPNGINYSS